ncbi:MAG TPA: hypothetical protein VF723_10355 [Pyrinomonadaceae bacterium]|jgi:hypothetical protein
MTKKEAQQRRQLAFEIRNQAAMNEKRRELIIHKSNGDEELYPNRIANYSKCLPHSQLGEVDKNAYDALLFAVRTNNFDDFDSIPLGGTKKLKGTMGGQSFSIQGPDSHAIAATPPPNFNSPELAAEMVELYWMALLRDVPFADYETHPLVSEAAKDLSNMPGFRGFKDPKTSTVTPHTLFRSGYPGTMDGPIISQFLLHDYTFDGATVTQKILMPIKDVDYLTSYDEWLAAQRGFPTGTEPVNEELEKKPRYIRNARDMGWVADASLLFTTYFKVVLFMFALDPVALDDGNPYKRSRAQSPFTKFGLGHLITLLGHVGPVPHAGVQKWLVHRFLRPEALSGRIHNHLTKAATYPFHASLLSSKVLDKVFKYNERVNKKRNLGKGTYLLPQEFSFGSPTHPSFPAGHGMAAGVGVTLLKSWFKEDFPLPDFLCVKPNRTGTALEPYRAGIDGPALTVGGELNKLAHNITWGRNMSGVHFWHDGFEANRMGEELAIRLLAEEGNTYAEPFEGFTLTKFDGTKIMV